MPQIAACSRTMPHNFINVVGSGVPSGSKTHERLTSGQPLTYKRTSHANTASRSRVVVPRKIIDA